MTNYEKLMEAMTPENYATEKGRNEMTFLESFITLCVFGAGIGFLFGVVYPIAMVVWYKLIGSGLTVREILRRI